MTTDAKVVRFPAPSNSENLRCTCGGEWWDCAVVIDKGTGRITGHSLNFHCTSCGQEADRG